MKRWKWQIAAGPGDFLPALIGCVMLFLTVPPFLILVFGPEQDTGGLIQPVLFIISVGVLIGVGFVVLGVQLLAMPGSLAYRLAHGRFFRH
jgi:hypothetical protein